jgi:hypothetical protein
MGDEDGGSRDIKSLGLDELKTWVTQNYTNRGVAVQSTGQRCFKVTLPQELENFEEFTNGISDRGGAIDLVLETDAMRAIIWDAGGPSRYKVKVGSSEKVVAQNSIFLLVVAIVLLAISSWILLRHGTSISGKS